MKKEILLPVGDYNEKSTYVLGIDIARQGKDETAFVILERLGFSDEIFVIHIETRNYRSLTETIGRTLHLDKQFDFDKIYIDATGLGGGVVDVLKETLKSKIQDVTFTRNSKADMFNNLKLLMQQNKLHIPDYNKNNDANCKKLYYQLLDIQQEYTSNSEIPKIKHSDRGHDDVVCSLCLAALHFTPVKRRRRVYGIAGPIR